MTSQGYDVFLSHSSRNADLASAMKQYLGEQGIRCWKAPDDISPAEDWPSAIMRALGECSIVVLIWTKDSMESRHVCREVTIADNRTKAIIPFRAEEIMPTGPLEFFLVNKQWLDAFRDYQPAFATLAATIHNNLGRHPGNPPHPPSPPTKTNPGGAQDAAGIDSGPTSPTPGPGPDEPPTGGNGEVTVGDEGSSLTLSASERRYLDALAQCDAYASDAELRDRLRWTEKTFDRTKSSLAERGLILAGSGRGGTSAVQTPRLQQLTTELLDDKLPGCIFVNIGEAKEDGNTPRDWGLCSSHGFISAGHGIRYAQDMKRIRPGATVYAYSSGAGYVGVGTATEAAVPLREFRIDGVLLQDQVPANPLFFHHLDDLEMCEWVVRVRWDKTLTRDQAIYRSGLFVHVATSCRIKDAITVQYLRSRFNQLLPDVVLTADDFTT